MRVLSKYVCPGLMVLLSVALVLGLAPTVDAKTKVLKYSDINAKKTAAGVFNEKFAELVEKNTQGRVKIEIFYGGTLSGFDIEPVQTGIADFTQWGFPTDYCPFSSVLDAPYMYESDEQLFKITGPQSPIFKKINDCLASKKTNLRLVSIYSWGFQHILTTKKAINKMADLQGLKIRVVPVDVRMETIRAMGATPTPMPWSEVMTSLMTGVIDGTGMPTVYIIPTGLADVEKHLTLTRQNPTLSAVYVNEKSWQSLSAEDQGHLLAAGVEARNHLKKFMDENNAKYMEQIKAKGVSVVPLEKLDIDTVKIREAVRDKFKDAWGDTYQQLLDMLK